MTDGEADINGGSPEEYPLLELLDVGVGELALRGEDFIICSPEDGLFAVFDGMGGHGEQGSGKTASTITAQFIYDRLKGKMGDVEAARSILSAAFYQANDYIASVGRMGTTGTVLKLLQSDGDYLEAVWASAGDSRIYLFRDNKLTQLSIDEGIGRGLYNAIGFGDNFELHQCSEVRVNPRDRFMLCSDGITGD